MENASFNRKKRQVLDIVVTNDANQPELSGDQLALNDLIEFGDWI